MPERYSTIDDAQCSRAVNVLVVYPAQREAFINVREIGKNNVGTSQSYRRHINNVARVHSAKYEIHEMHVFLTPR